MTTWRDISADNEYAAKRLIRFGHWRSAVSRAYYAVYSQIAGRLREQGLVFSTDRANPSHAELPALVESNVAGLSRWQRRDLKAAARYLYSQRLSADYDESAATDEAVARESLIVMAAALSILRTPKEHA